MSRARRLEPKRIINTIKFVLNVNLIERQASLSPVGRLPQGRASTAVKLLREAFLENPLEMPFDSEMKSTFLFRLALVAACVPLCSCASVSVREVIPLGRAPLQLPQTIVVQPFDFEDDMVRVGRQGAELEDFKRRIQQELTANLVERIRKYLAPAQAAGIGTPQGNAWLIAGRFTRLNQGSRFLRGALGFGSGGTKMDVTATVTDISGGVQDRFLVIQTTGGTNAMPGAIMGIIAWPMITSGAPGLLSGLSGDTQRTAREVTNALAAYMKDHGLRVAADVPKPKPKGGLPQFSDSGRPKRD